jgi:hypothetical protein
MDYIENSYLIYTRNLTIKKDVYLKNIIQTQNF